MIVLAHHDEKFLIISLLLQTINGIVNNIFDEEIAYNIFILQTQELAKNLL